MPRPLRRSPTGSRPRGSCGRRRDDRRPNRLPAGFRRGNETTRSGCSASRRSCTVMGRGVPLFTRKRFSRVASRSTATTAADGLRLLRGGSTLHIDRVHLARRELCEPEDREVARGCRCARSGAGSSEPRRSGASSSVRPPNASACLYPCSDIARGKLAPRVSAHSGNASRRPASCSGLVIPESARTRIFCHSSIHVSPMRRVGAPSDRAASAGHVPALAEQPEELMVEVVTGELGRTVLQDSDLETGRTERAGQPAEVVCEPARGRHGAPRVPDLAQLGVGLGRRKGGAHVAPRM